MAGHEVRHVLDVKAELGESPVWSVEEQALFWVDIEHKTINRFDPARGTNRAWDVPATPGCIALREGGGAVIASNLGYFDFDFASEAIEKICDAPFDGAVFRFNDGKPDRQGRFWAGTLPFAFKMDGPGEGSFYCYDAGKVTKGFDGVRVPNGVCFSLDGRTMHRAESMDLTMLAYDYDPDTGTPSNERVYKRLPQGFGVLDGATFDSEGGMWMAVPYGGDGKGRVVRYAPDGEVDIKIEMPTITTTMTMFGGPDMATLYVTSGRIESLQGLPVSPLGGDIFAIDTGFRGVPETLVKRA